MRGPGYRTSGDPRRTWRCSQCGRERKVHGEITTLQCVCKDGMWMKIVAERTMAPRPLQQPSDVERRPIDFGIEPTPTAPPKPEATIIKSAISRDDQPELEVPKPIDPGEQQPNFEKPASDGNLGKLDPVEDDWGEGIL